ncbi:HXXEE domain-containing protein [Bisgaard Taxon 45]
MQEYIWFFPLIFIFHELEELIGMKRFLSKNRLLFHQKYPFIYKVSQNFSTEGLAFAVLEEFILCITLCFCAFFMTSHVTSGLWLGAFIACTFHFVVHILQTLILRQYIPATITSLICLPISLWIIYQCFLAQEYGLTQIFPYLCIGFFLVVINLFFAQKLIGIFTRLMKSHLN